MSEKMVIYGAHPVEELLMSAPDRAERVVALDWRAPNALEAARLADEAGIERERASARELDDLCGEGAKHQGIALVAKAFQYVGLDQIIAQTRKDPMARVVILDSVQDVGNLGAILRSAAALGVAGAIIPKNRSASVTPAAVRASAGQALRVPVARVTNLVRAMDELKEAGFWVVGSALGDTRGRAPWSLDLKSKIALVIGSEHSGMRRLVAKNCDLIAEIPMASGVESMNASAAAAALLYEAARQKQSEGVADSGNEMPDG